VLLITRSLSHLISFTCYLISDTLDVGSTLSVSLLLSQAAFIYSLEVILGAWKPLAGCRIIEHKLHIARICHEWRTSRGSRISTGTKFTKTHLLTTPRPVNLQHSPDPLAGLKGKQGDLNLYWGGTGQLGVKRMNKRDLLRHSADNGFYNPPMNSSIP